MSPTWQKKPPYAMKEKKTVTAGIRLCVLVLKMLLPCLELISIRLFFFLKQKVEGLLYDSKEKQGYCVVWNEALCRRAGNDIASPVLKALSAISSAHPDFKNYILWSDSCVPKKNTVVSHVVLFFATNSSVEAQASNDKIFNPRSLMHTISG